MGNSNRLFTFGLPIAYAAPGPLQIRQRNVYHMIRAFDPGTFGVKCSPNDVSSYYKYGLLVPDHF